MTLKKNRSKLIVRVLVESYLSFYGPFTESFKSVLKLNSNMEFFKQDFYKTSQPQLLCWCQQHSWMYKITYCFDFMCLISVVLEWDFSNLRSAWTLGIYNRLLHKQVCIVKKHLHIHRKLNHFCIVKLCSAGLLCKSLIDVFMSDTTMICVYFLAQIINFKRFSSV